MFLPKHVIAPCVVVSGPDHRSDQPKPTAKTCDRTGPCCTRSTRPLWPTILPTVIPMIAVRRHAIAPPCLVSERTTHGQSEPGPSNFERRRQAPVYHPHGLLEANHPKRRLWVGRARRPTFADETGPTAVVGLCATRRSRRAPASGRTRTAFWGRPGRRDSPGVGYNSPVSSGSPSR